MGFVNFGTWEANRAFFGTFLGHWSRSGPSPEIGTWGQTLPRCKQFKWQTAIEAWALRNFACGLCINSCVKYIQMFHGSSDIHQQRWGGRESRYQLAINLDLVWWGLPHRKFGKCVSMGPKVQVVFLCTLHPQMWDQGWQWFCDYSKHPSKGRVQKPQSRKPSVRGVLPLPPGASTDEIFPKP